MGIDELLDNSLVPHPRGDHESGNAVPASAVNRGPGFEKQPYNGIVPYLRCIEKGRLAEMVLCIYVCPGVDKLGYGHSISQCGRNH